MSEKPHWISARRRIFGMNLLELSRATGIGTGRLSQIDRHPQGRDAYTAPCFWDGVDEHGNAIGGYDPAREFPAVPAATDDELSAIRKALASEGRK